MRNISFSMTTQQVRNRTKFVTRRTGWQTLQAGDCLRAIEKGQGLKKGEKIKVICLIRVTRINREKLGHFYGWGADECALEGFPELTPDAFVEMFCRTHQCDVNTEIARIEFEYL